METRFREGDDDWDEDSQRRWALAQGRIHRAVHGRPGQAALRELEAALLALPKPRLISGELCRDGEVCALGAIALYRQVRQGYPWEEAAAILQQRTYQEPVYGEDFDEDGWIDCTDQARDTADWAVRELGLTFTLAYAIEEANDEGLWYGASPEQRFRYVLRWVRDRLSAELRKGEVA